MPEQSGYRMRLLTSQSDGLTRAESDDSIPDLETVIETAETKNTRIKKKLFLTRISLIISITMLVVMFTGIALVVNKQAVEDAGSQFALSLQQEVTDGLGMTLNGIIKSKTDQLKSLGSIVSYVAATANATMLDWNMIYSTLSPILFSGISTTSLEYVSLPLLPFFPAFPARMLTCLSRAAPPASHRLTGSCLCTRAGPAPRGVLL